MHLQQNKISQIDPQTFQQMNTLLYLNLEINQLKVLKSNLFSSLIQLTYLDISDNQINAIERNIFDNLTRINDVFATGNECIDKSAISGLNTNLNLQFETCFKGFE